MRPRTRTRRRKPQAFTGPAFEPCGQCVNGWVMRVDNTAERCACFRRHMTDRALADVFDPKRAQAGEDR